MSAEREDARRRGDAPPDEQVWPAAGAPAAGTEDGLLAGLPALLRDLAAAGVVELEVSVGQSRLYVRQRPGALPAIVAVPAGPAEAEQEPAEEAGLLSVVTPLAGVFYRSPAPEEPLYVEEGDDVEAGQVVGLIEAMKVFNEIHVEVAGTVAKLLATGGQTVQAGQPLMKIRPHA